jgi:hypothetical protein
MKYCFPAAFGPRRSGLGNELIPLAKAFIASSELGLRFLPTSWGLNSRGYGSYFGSSRLDWVRALVLSKVLPSYRFCEADYLSTGEVDFDRAIRVYAEARGLSRQKSYVLLTEGMWGGYRAIRKARPFILKTLHGTRYTAENLYAFEKAVGHASLRVAVSIRLTDFAQPSGATNYQGLWNTRVPLEWYSRVCRHLRDAFGDNLAIVLLSDGTEAELTGFVREFDPLMTKSQRHTAVSDLLLMANADLLVCSISSYSQWAAFLSGSPYIWYRPHLTPVGELLTMWGSCLGEPSAGATRGRGVPVDDLGAVPTWVLDWLTERRELNDASTDLVQGGGVSIAPLHTGSNGPEQKQATLGNGR